MSQVYYDCYGNQLSEEEVFKEDKMPTDSKSFSFTSVIRSYMGEGDSTKAAINASIAPTVKEVIFAPPATIVYWQDGSRTVVKCDENDEFNEEVGFALCFVKKMLGNSGSYNNYIRKQIKNAKRYYNTPTLLAAEILEELNKEVDLDWKKLSF